MSRLDNPQKLYKAFESRKKLFYEYIERIKKSLKTDFYYISNTTLITNPYITSFPTNFFLQNYTKESKTLRFLSSCTKFYTKQFYILFSYILSFIIYKIYYKPKKVALKNTIGIDVFLQVDNIIKFERFDENYFKNLYAILDKYNQRYVFLPRLYGSVKNPLKLKKFFQIINEDKRSFLFEFELLSVIDIICIFFMIIKYPFKTLRLLQKNNSLDDAVFNAELLRDIPNLGSEVFNRYIFGKNIAKTDIDRIYSWAECHVTERSFNYGIRVHSEEIELIACQFFLNYETYFNAYFSDIDYDMLSSAHKVLVNGQYYLLNRKRVKYEVGPSLRYQSVIKFDKKIEPENVVLLGTFLKETKYMLDCVSDFERVLFKKHPITNLSQFKNIGKNIEVVNKPIYKLFENASVIINTSSGTALEAVACGVSTIVVADKKKLAVNPLVEYGKGKIWDIAFNKEDIGIVYNRLITYRKNNIDEIQEIASWYKNNFFVEPSEVNIVKAFELNKD